MKKLFNIKNLILVVLLFALFAAPFSQIVSFSEYKVFAETPQEKVDRLQKQLDDIRAQEAELQAQLDSNTYTINGYNSQVSSLQGEAQLYQKQIDQLRLEIEQLQTNIEILNGQISDNQKLIKSTEDTIAGLETESSLRIKNSYMNYRMYGNIEGGSKILVIDNINNYFKDSQYKELIQSSTNELMVKVAQLKQELSDKKKELDRKLIELKRSKEDEDVKKSDLDKKKEDVDLKLVGILFSN